ncbi:hypothetical protein [Helicobacter bizzozeronii]|uniref:hypothetical protein n=1 Tax=Helicobacter bizzozeronii TaxID=56877 RepID=UPI000557F292|nr:hypothetical protein [Helicobacter bizzozeronii]
MLPFVLGCIVGALEVVTKVYHLDAIKEEMKKAGVFRFCFEEALAIQDQPNEMVNLTRRTKHTKAEMLRR